MCKGTLLDMFVDKAEVEIEAGSGGNGVVSFRHEKFVDRGGPDGGDGGNGGDVIFEASRNQNTLANFRYQRLLKAESGKPGSKQKRHGKSGKDLIIPVPVGTVVQDESGQILADLYEDGQQAVIAKGGRGGFGNAHFVSSRRQAPKVAERGEPGEKIIATLELKMIADVGLVGLPNAGKSTLLSVISNARPEIANYPFTTVRPNLGVVEVDKEVSLLFADIPGLIEGASEGKGLGDEFLRHIERTKVLVHLIDIYQDDVAGSYVTIQKELQSYKVDLTDKPQIVVLNKIDGLDEEIIQDKMAQLQSVVPKDVEVRAVSAQSKSGVKELLYKVKELVQLQRQAAESAGIEAAEQLPVLRLTEDENSWHIERDGEAFIVTGKKIERFALRTDFENPDGVQRLRDIMRKMGIMRELERQGMEPGMTIHIGDSGDIEY